MRIINHGIASEVKKGIVEVCESFFEVAKEEIGNALLKISNSEILIETNGSLVAFDLQKRRISISWADLERHKTYSLFVLAEGSMDDTHVEENLAGIAYLFEIGERIVKLVIVVSCEGRNPCLNFLRLRSMGGAGMGGVTLKIEEEQHLPA